MKYAEDPRCQEIKQPYPDHVEGKCPRIQEIPPSFQQVLGQPHKCINRINSIPTPFAEPTVIHEKEVERLPPVTDPCAFQGKAPCDSLHLVPGTNKIFHIVLEPSDYLSWIAKLSAVAEVIQYVECSSKAFFPLDSTQAMVIYGEKEEGVFLNISSSSADFRLLEGSPGANICTGPPMMPCPLRHGPQMVPQLSTLAPFLHPSIKLQSHGK